MPSREECGGLQWSTRAAFAESESATKTGGSPGRRGAFCVGTLQPVTRSTAEITSYTE